MIDDNIGRRPFSVLGRPSRRQRPWLWDVLTSYCQYHETNLMLAEVSRSRPPLAVERPSPLVRSAVPFGRRRAAGAPEPGLELLGYDAQPYRRGGLPWLRVSYYWPVHNQALARLARVWVLFTDDAANYRRQADGSPEFENIHPLAYGTGSPAAPLPGTLRETYDLYVPPGERNRSLRLRIAVADGETFLASGAASRTWVELGKVTLLPS